jgi:hypothetical protein
MDDVLINRKQRDLIRKMARTLAVCHECLDRKKIQSPDVDLSWVFEDIETSLDEARFIIGSEIPVLPVSVDEHGVESVIRPF